MIDVLAIPGTSEAQSPNGRPIGMIKSVTDLLPRDRFDCYTLAYPRTYGPFPHMLGVDYQSSVSEGVKSAIRWIRESPNPVGLIGYSQGCAVITQILERIEAGELDDLEISFAALIANPHRAKDHSLDWSVTGYGISGEHGPWPVGDFPIFELANDKDPICCLSAGSPIRSFYDLTSSFSVSNVALWGRSLFNVVNSRRQAWWEIPVIGRWTRALDDVLNFVARGEHVMYDNPKRPFPGQKHSYTTHLAKAIIREV